ncbi:unnamed protein product [Adineta steineri]|uniref:Uncharacterized protein n=1 Tax=Adineta steineri TaxID=433720 RepID=A0A818W1D2_9BILA|nr:unnamed protein product [Adineta steineri]CAF3718965.1 unnamed protein product [Adineta steineri]
MMKKILYYYITKSLINAFLNIKLSLGQLLHTGSFQYAVCFETTLLLKNSLQPADPDREAYFIHLTKPSFYRQPGAINKDIEYNLMFELHIVDVGVAIPLQQYDPPTKLTTTDNLTSS